MSTILKYATAFILSLVLAAFGYRMIMTGIDMIRYGSAEPGETEYTIESDTDHDSDDFYDSYEPDDDGRNHYEEEEFSREEQYEFDEKVRYLEENTDFGFFDENFIYISTLVGSEYVDLFFDEGWMLRQDYIGYEGENYDKRMEFWEADSEEFDTIAYVFSREALFIVFPDDVFYMYSDVDKETFAGLLRTDSRDEYFDEHIEGSFVSKRLT